MIPRHHQPDEELHLCADPPAGEQEETREGSDAVGFLQEDQELERELNTFFNLQGENLPPLFVQTLMSERNTWTIPAGLEERLVYRVFRRLELPLPASHKQKQGPGQKPPGYHPLWHLPRALGLGATLGLALLLLVIFLPALGQEANIFIVQGQLSTTAYSGIPRSSLALTQYLSPRQTEESVPFSIYWLDRNPLNYTYQSLLLHMGQPWSDGPVVELRYGHGDPRIGYGYLVIREFRPARGDTPLEVVDPTSAQMAQLGDTSVVYVNGQWVQENGETFWQMGFQTQLLYQAPDGLVFWLIADARDEATFSSFEALLQLLQPLYQGPPRTNLPELSDLPQAEAAAALPPVVAGMVVGQILVGTSADLSATVYIALGSLPDGPPTMVLPTGGGHQPDPVKA